MTHGRRHAPDLAIFPLGEFQGDPSVGYGLTNPNRWHAGRYRGRGIEQLSATRTSHGAVQFNLSGREAREGFGRRATFDLNPIFAAMALAWIEQFGIQSGLVAEKQKALAVGVEAAQGVDAARKFEIGERAPLRTRLGGELRQDTVGFVEREEHGSSAHGRASFRKIIPLLAVRVQRAQLTAMQAAQLTALNQLNVTDVPAPVPAAGEVVVTLRAAALNHRDLWIKLGQYPGLKYPAQPGSDGAGVVSAVGSGVEATWLGREVVINPSFDWGASEYAQGAAFTILGLPRAGTLAQQIAVPVVQLAAKPAHLSWVEAAALPLAGLTAYRALFARAQLRAGEKILITGIGGGVALFALQFAVAHGAEVWVTSSSAEKIKRAVALGARGGFDYTRDGWAAQVIEHVPGGAFDVIVDSAGGPGFEHVIDLAASGGRIVFFGATRGNPPVLPMRKVFWRNLSVLGTTMGSPTDWQAMLGFVACHRIAPVVCNVFPLEHVGEAFDLMERGEQFGKIVITL